MASKSRGGLSKREYAAKKLGGTLNYKKGTITVKKSNGSSLSSAQKQAGINTLNSKYSNKSASSFGDLNKQWSNSDLALLKSYQTESPTETLQRNQYSKYLADKTDSTKNPYGKTLSQQDVSNRAKAAQANQLSQGRVAGASTSNMGNVFRNIAGINTAEASTGSVRQTPKKTWYERGLEIMKDPFGAEPKLRGLIADKPWENGIGSLLSYNPNENKIYQIEEGAGDAISQYMNGVTPNLGISDNTPMSTDYEQPYQDNRPETSPVDNWKQAQEDASNNTVIDYKNNRQKPTRDENYSDPYGNGSASSPEEVSQLIYDKPATPYAETTGSQGDTGTVKRPFGSGAYGNGAGVSNVNMTEAEKEYIKQMRRSAGGDFGMRDAKKELENVLNGIGDQFNEDKRLGENELNKSKNEDLMKLMSLFGAYGTSDSEQRMQAQGRTNDSYNESLAELVAKLTATKNSNITSAKNNALSTFQQIGNQKKSAQDNLAKLIYDLQNSSEEKAYQRRKDAASLGKSSSSKIYNSINDLASNWVSNQSDPYSRSGGREAITRQIAAQYGGNAKQYESYLPNGWESTFWNQPQQKSANIVSIGNGYVLDKDSGEVYQAYEED